MRQSCICYYSFLDENVLPVLEIETYFEPNANKINVRPIFVLKIKYIATLYFYTCKKKRK